MVARVVLFALIAALPSAAQAVQPAPLLPREFGLPYDLTGFVVEPPRVAPAPQPAQPPPAAIPAPRPEPAPPQIAARSPLDYRVTTTLYDRAPDHIALVYDLRGFLPPWPAPPPSGPLEYELGGLLGIGSP